ncbi:hypothetical protein PR048_006760 [Dryococelus australis]|uniref:Uncharacterized protein n=1 Tax=Dryococelus australis TaxID=614101 RepID=A0ABQ9IBU1_9NEOP|nr:hypothetical protein PR048_006760 [Dryococelus australis]
MRCFSRTMPGRISFVQPTEVFVNFPDQTHHQISPPVSVFGTELDVAWTNVLHHSRLAQLNHKVQRSKQVIRVKSIKETLTLKELGLLSFEENTRKYLNEDSPILGVLFNAEVNLDVMKRMKHRERNKVLEHRRNEEGLRQFVFVMAGLTCFISGESVAEEDDGFTVKGRFTDSIKAVDNDKDYAWSRGIIRRTGTVADLVAAERQFVFDNADINMDTIDGHDMEGIQCFTPKTSISPRAPIDKIRSIPSATSGVYGTIPLGVFQKPHPGGLASLMVQNVINGDRKVLLMSTDLAWMDGKWKELDLIPGWNGFMESITSNKSFVSSRMLCLPFIKAPPSNYGLIYPVLKTIAHKLYKTERPALAVWGHILAQLALAKTILSTIDMKEENSAILTILSNFGTGNLQINPAWAELKMRENTDIQIFCDWFDSHDLLPLGDTIMCVNNGVLGNENINRHKAYEIGKSSTTNITGSNFKELKFQRKKMGNATTKEQFSYIIDKYMNYFKNHYMPNASIVLDGSPEDATENSIKSAEVIRTARNMLSASVAFDDTMALTMLKEQFLSKDQKKCMISMLANKLTAQHFHAKTVFIVGEDIELLVLLTAQEQPEPFCNNFLLKPGKGHDNLMYSSNNCKLYEEAKKNILFLHVFSGCDSTLQRAVSAFMEPDATPNQDAEAGATFILSQRELSKIDFNMTFLPPTEAVARQHSLRAYFQVQVWKNNFLNTRQWGWKTTKHGLLTNATDQTAAPQELLDKISLQRHTCTNSPSEDEFLQVDVTSYEEEVDITEDRLTFDPFLDELDADTEMVQLEAL